MRIENKTYEELKANYNKLLAFVTKISNLEGDAMTFRFYLIEQAGILLKEVEGKIDWTERN